MAKTGGRILRIIGTAESDGAKHKVAGEPIILVGDTSDIKGTKGDTGPVGPVWTPIVDTGVTLDLGAPTGAIDLGDGNFLPVYAEDGA